MNQWSRQYGYEIGVIWYYPYIAGAGDASGSSGAVPGAENVLRRSSAPLV